MPVIWPPKDADEVCDRAIDFADRLGDDTISSASFSLVTAAGVTIDSSEYGDTFATARLSGGTTGSRASILCEIETADGQTLQESAFMVIRTR